MDLTVYKVEQLAFLSFWSYWPIRTSHWSSIYSQIVNKKHVHELECPPSASFQNKLWLAEQIFFLLFFSSEGATQRYIDRGRYRETTIGSLSNDNGDVNENGKKGISLE